MTTEAQPQSVKFHAGKLLSLLSKERQLPLGEKRHLAHQATVFSARDLLNAAVGAEVDLFKVLFVMHIAVPSMTRDINRAVGEGLTLAAQEAK